MHRSPNDAIGNLWGSRSTAVPDIIGKTSIRVYGADPAHSAGWWAVLRHIHVVSGSGEPRRLVCIQHCYSDRGPVLEGASTQEARIHNGVEDLHRERVGASAFIIYRLERKEEKKSKSVGLKIFHEK